MESRDESTWFTQSGYRCRFEWGRRGARVAAERGDVLVVVDTLSFSTAAITAVAAGGFVLPCRPDEDASALAERVGATLAVHRSEVTVGGYSLSPRTLATVRRGEHVVLPSPNGSLCCRHGRSVPLLLVAALVNASAVAQACARLLDTTELGITVLACGERWRERSEDGPLRYALEDALGAGAVLAQLPSAHCSPEARACAESFRALRGELELVLANCGSGRELVERGFPGDVSDAARLDRFAVVPVLEDDILRPVRDGDLQNTSPQID